MAPPKKSRKSTTNTAQSKRQVDPIDSATSAVMSTELISLLPRFSGAQGENWTEFKAQFNNIAELSEWEENEKLLILKTRLTGKAFSLIVQLEGEKQDCSWEEITAALANKFEKKRSSQEKQRRFEEIKYGPGMTMEELGNIVRSRTKEYLAIKQESAETRDLLNRLMLQKFLEVVREDIALEIRKAEIEDFERAVEKAKRLEEILGITVTANTLQAEAKSGIKEIVHSLEMVKLKEEMQEIKNQLKRLTEIKERRENKCEICGRSNHSEERCWFRNQGNRYGNNNFGRRGAPNNLRRGGVRRNWGEQTEQNTREYQNRQFTENRGRNREQGDNRNFNGNRRDYQEDNLN